MAPSQSRFTCTLMLVGTLALLAGCSATSETPTADAPTEIRMATRLPSTLDPTAGTSSPDFFMARQLFDTLIRKDDSGLVPGLASSWEATPTSLTLVLRNGSTCADGTEITASIVKDSLEYFARADNTGSTPVVVFGPGNSPEIVADDAAETVSISIQSPWPDLTSGLAVASTGIVCPAGLADPDGLAAGTVPDALSGPYSLVSQDPGVAVELALRGDYDAWPEWNEEIPGVPAQTLKFTVSSDAMSVANQLEARQIDVATVSDPDALARLTEDAGFTTEFSPGANTFLVFNERDTSPFSDPDLRRAVAALIDSEAFANVVQPGIAEPATSIAADTTCYDPSLSAVLPLDPSAGAALEGVTIRLIGPQAAGPNGAGNEYVQEVLRAAGANVELANTDLGTWVTTALSKPSDWDLSVYMDINYLGGPVSTFLRFSGPTTDLGGGNVGAVANTAADELFAGALNVVAQDERCGVMNQAVNALVSAADVVPLTNFQTPLVSREGFYGKSLAGQLDDYALRVVD